MSDFLQTIDIFNELCYYVINKIVHLKIKIMFTLLAMAALMFAGVFALQAKDVRPEKEYKVSQVDHFTSRVREYNVPGAKNKAKKDKVLFVKLAKFSAVLFIVFTILAIIF